MQISSESQNNISLLMTWEIYVLGSWFCFVLFSFYFIYLVCLFPQLLRWLGLEQVQGWKEDKSKQITKLLNISTPSILIAHQTHNPASQFSSPPTGGWWKAAYAWQKNALPVLLTARACCFYPLPLSCVNPGRFLGWERIFWTEMILTVV